MCLSSSPRKCHQTSSEDPGDQQESLKVEKAQETEGTADIDHSLPLTANKQGAVTTHLNRQPLPPVEPGGCLCSLQHARARKKVPGPPADSMHAQRRAFELARPPLPSACLPQSHQPLPLLLSAMLSLTLAPFSWEAQLDTSPASGATCLHGTHTHVCLVTACQPTW